MPLKAFTIYGCDGIGNGVHADIINRDAHNAGNQDPRPEKLNEGVIG